MRIKEQETLLNLHEHDDDDDDDDEVPVIRVFVLNYEEIIFTYGSGSSF